jgi:HEAT repeat protein
MPLIQSTPDKPPPRSGDVRTALLSGSVDERWEAARNIAQTKDGAPILAEALAREEDARVREAIFTGLARIATEQSALAVVPHLRSDDASLRAGALAALRAMPGAARPHLKGLLSDPDADVRLLACDLARGQPAGEAIRLLAALLESEPEPNVCGAAVDVLAEIGEVDATPVLLRCADRFRADPFLSFAIKVAVDRLRARSSDARG